MRVRLADRAVDDLEVARDYYAQRELAGDFERDFDGVLERIITFPHGAPPVDAPVGARRARMRRFPFGVFYLPQDHVVVVLRVLHSRRDTASALAD